MLPPLLLLAIVDGDPSEEVIVNGLVMVSSSHLLRHRIAIHPSRIVTKAAVKLQVVEVSLLLVFVP